MIHGKIHQLSYPILSYPSGNSSPLPQWRAKEGKEIKGYVHAVSGKW